MQYRNYLSITILLIITIFLTWGFYFYAFPHQDSIDIKNFPLRIGSWTGKELSIGKADQSKLETKNVFLRRYTDLNGHYVYLYISYSQSDSKATNPPEISYEGSNISILDKGKESIIINPSQFSVKANWLVLDDNQNQQLAYYWFKVGGVYTQSYWKQQFIAAFNNLIGQRTGSALIRISADIVNGHQHEAIRVMNEFASLLGPQLSYLP